MQEERKQEKAEETKKGEQELLSELVTNSQKQLVFARIGAIAALAAAAAFVIGLLILVPKILHTVKEANEVMAEAANTITQAQAAIDSITDMSDSISAMGENLDSLITDNAESITAVMQKLDAIDFEGLNGAIRDLGEVVEPLANFFHLFNR